MTQPIVLIVDDTRDTLEMFAMTLAAQPWNLITAATAGEALAIMDATHIDLAVIDVAMPLMGGVELATEIRRRDGCKIAFLTATDLDLSEVAEIGIVPGGVWRKPILPGDLAALVGTALAA